MLSGKTAIQLCRRLGEDWYDLARYLDIPLDRRKRFESGREGHGILDWLEERDRSHELSEALKHIGRQDLVKLLDMPSDSKPEALQPDYPDEQTRDLSQALDAAYKRLDDLVAAGQDTTVVQNKILSLRRQIREGGQLKEGDFLSNGRFKLLERIGYGGFASVWKGVDRQHHELVALKVLHGQYAHDRTRCERFFRGARQMAALRHPGIVWVFEKELIDEGFHFFVMEYLPGGDFQQAVLDNIIPVEDRLAVIAAVGEALQLAHAQGLVHRDIKPANIVLSPECRPKLTDFDLVRAEDTTGGTRTGALGTWIYAAPELMDKPQDAGVCADVYGLGMTALFALYGAKLPYAVLSDKAGFVESLDTASAIKPVLLRAIAWDWKERYTSVAEFCQALAESDKSSPERLKDKEAEAGTTHDADVVFRDSFREDNIEGPEMIWLPGGSFKMGSENGRDNPFTLGAQKPAQAPEYKPYHGFSDPLKDGAQAPEMVYLPGGTFKMGDIQGKGYDDERPVHEVTLDAFAIGKYPVTVGDFQRFVDAKGYQTEAEREGGAFVYDGKEWGEKSDANWRNPYIIQAEDHPVVCISWNDAVAYCEWLCEQTGEHYELLTEAQWEYACRAGSDTRYCHGNDEQQLEQYAWYSKNAEGSTHLVGKKPANAWQLYDMHGNVWEWVRDCFEDYSGEPQSNPSGPASGSIRVFRGGGWDDDADYCRSAYRLSDDPGNRYGNLGFRLARRV